MRILGQCDKGAFGGLSLARLRDQIFCLTQGVWLVLCVWFCLVSFFKCIRCAAFQGSFKGSKTHMVFLHQICVFVQAV